MKRFIKFGCEFFVHLWMQDLMAQTQKTMHASTDREKVTWFSMWFMGAVATFGVAFFGMFYRLIDSRNKHFRREAAFEEQIAAELAKHGRSVPAVAPAAYMNAKAWAASIILVIPAFVVDYYLSRDLLEHEKQQEAFLAAAFPERMFMQQTIPIKKYALISIVTLGIGGIYWLYKVANLYNAHFKAQWKLEKEIARLMEEIKVGESM